MKKRLLSLLLCLVMVFSLLPVNVLAVEVEPVAEAEEEELILTDPVQEEEELPAGEEPAPPAEPEEEESEMEPEETTEEAAAEEEPEVSAASEEGPEVPEEDVQAEGEGLSGNVADSGTCGDGLSWTLTKDGTLTISGEGEMESYGWDSVRWNGHADEIVSLVVEEGVSSIGFLAFHDCENLEYVTLATSVTTLKGGAFVNCTGLTSVELPEGVETIENDVFNNCTALTSIAVPASAMSIHYAAFLFVPAGAVHVSPDNPNYCTDTYGALFNKAMTELISVPDLPAYTIPASVTIIGQSAFFMCTSLKKVSIPAGVTGIGSNAFDQCTSLESVTIPAGVKTIGTEAFLNSISLTKIRFEHPEAAELAIGNGAFDYDGGLGSLGLPVSTVIQIPDANSLNPAISGYDWAGSNRTVAFESAPTSGTTEDGLIWKMNAQGTITITGYDEALMPADLVIPAEIENIPVKVIGEKAFSACGTLHSVVVSEGIEVIEYSAFGDYQSGGTGSIASVSLPESLVSIGEGAFTGCFDLNGEIYISSNVQSIGEEAFRLTSIRRFNVSPDNPYFRSDESGVLFTKDLSILKSAPAGIYTYVVPEGVLVVESGAFVNCYGTLTSIVLPESLTTIESGVFYQCWQLAELTIPANVTEIGNQPFPYCTSLTRLSVDSANPAYRCDDGIALLSKDGTILYQAIGSLSGAYRIPESVTTLHSCAFQGCQNLREVIFPATVESISSAFFDGCDRLTTLRFEHSATARLTIESDAFYTWAWNWETGERIVLATLVCVQDPNNINPAITGYNWEQSNRRVTYDSLDAIPPLPPEGEWGGLTFGPAADGLGVEITGWTDELPEELVIPSEINGYPVTAIADYAFSECASLRKVTLQEGIVSIGRCAFSWCEDLEEIVLPSGLMTIGFWAFNGTAIQNIFIPASVERIDSEAFYSTQSLERIDVDEANQSYRSADGVVFSKDGSILEQYPDAREGAYTVPEGVAEIGAYAFYGSKGLTAVTLPGTLSAIRESAFQECGLKTAICLPAGVTTVEQCAFGGIYTTINVDEGNQTFSAKDGTLFSKDGSVLVAATSGFTGAYEIPDGVTRILPYAFMFPRITEITIPSSVENIERAAFWSCRSLRLIRFDHVETDSLSIGEWAFGGVSGLGTEIRVPDTEAIHPAIRTYDWLGDGRPVTLALSERNGVWNGLIYAPAAAPGEIVIAGYTEDLPAQVEIPSEIHGYIVTGIWEEAFRECTTMTSITFPETVRSIGDYAISWCYGLKTIELPKSVTTLGDCVFYHCDNLLSIQVDEDNPAYSSDEAGVLFNKYRTTLIQYPLGRSGAYDIPDGVILIGRSAFNFAHYITAVTIPESVTTIGELAFSYCTSLRSVAIPASVRSLGSAAFNMCSRLRMVAFAHTGSDPLRMEKGCFRVMSNTKLAVMVPDPESIPAALLKYSWKSDRRKVSFVGPSSSPELPLPRLSLTPDAMAPAELVMLDANGEETFAEAFAEAYAVYLDATAVSGKRTYSFRVIPELLDAQGETWRLSSKTIKYVSSDTKIASVKTNSDGSAVVTVKAGANGACTISASSTLSGQKQESSLSVYVRDYTPRLESKTITVNSWKTVGVSVPLREGYQNAISRVSIGNALFAADWSNEALTVRALEPLAKNGSFKTTLTVTTQRGEYSLPITIAVKNAMPAVNVKQTQKYNSFYTDSKALFELSAPGEITGAGFETATYQSTFADGVLTVTKKTDAPVKAAAKGTLTVNVAGYTKPFTKTVTVAAENKKPGLKLSGTAFTVNTAYGNKSVEFAFIGDLPKTRPDITVKPVGAANYTYNNGIFTVTDIMKTATLTIKVLETDWTLPMTFTVKITANGKLPVAKIAPKTLLLNTAHPGAVACAAVTINAADVTLRGSREILSGTGAEAAKLLVVYENGTITAKIRNGMVPKAGTYKYTYTPVIETPDGLLMLNAVTVSVKVVSTSVITPTVTAAGKLDAVRRSETAITYTVTKLANVTGEVTGIELEGDDAALFELTPLEVLAKGLAQAVLTLKEGVDVSTKASYKIQLSLTVEGVDVPVLSKVLTVKVTQSKLKLTAVPKTATLFQGQDTTQPAEFTLTLTAPAGAKIKSVALSQKTPLAFWNSLGKNAVVNWMPHADGTVLVQISVKDPSKVVNGKSYKVVLDVTAEGNATNVKPTAVTVTVKVMK